jgi:Mg2+ and Co2+ transporter CorA
MDVELVVELFDELTDHIRIVREALADIENVQTALANEFATVCEETEEETEEWDDENDDDPNESVKGRVASLEDDVVELREEIRQLRRSR